MTGRPRPHAQDPAVSWASVARPEIAAPPPLPTPIASLVGREAEVQAVVASLLRDHVRLVTLTGPGGVGKSRLALAASAELSSHFADGVWLVRLAAISDPDRVLPAIAAALGIADMGDQPTLHTLQATLADRHLLLLLDNFEQVAAAGADLADLLRACPNVKALVTSRSRLRVRGEHLVPVSPLAFPGPDAPLRPEDLADYPAVALFVQRGREVRPDLGDSTAELATIAAICRQLDGLPLAIELAAARLDILPPAALRERLRPSLPLLVMGARDLPDRLRTMRDAIAWSYALLDDDERRLFRLLAVFASGFTAEAVAAVAGLPDEATTLGLLSSLCDKSLIFVRTDSPVDVPEGPRFGMLATIREFARERLAFEQEAEQARAAHAAYYLRLAERSFFPIYDAADPTWLDRLHRDHDNLRAALTWYQESGAAEPFLRLAGRLGYYWYYRGFLQEGRRWLSEALRDLPASVPAHPRAWALTVGALLATVAGEWEFAARMLEESFPWWEQTDDRVSQAIARSLLGGARVSQGRYDEAEPLFAETLAFLRDSGDTPWTAHALFHLGVIAFARGDHSRARGLLRDAEMQYVARGSRIDAIDALRYLGLLECAAGNLDAAAALFADAMSLLRQRGSRAALAVGLADAATYAAWRGAWPDAALLFATAERVLESEGGAFSLPARDAYVHAQARVRDALGPAAFESAVAEGRLTSLDAALSAADAMLALPVDGPHRTQTREQQASGNHLLTDREWDVLRLLAAGKSNPEIAEALYIGRGTVRTHVSNILGKLGARTRTEAAALACDQGLL